MIKTATTLIISIIGLFVNYLYTNEVNLYAKYPAEVKAGESFNVDITVEKGNLSEFGRFTQELPEGFTAESNDKLFSFKENKVKFLWITLPAGSSYTFSYSINVPPSFTGECTLTGGFAYIMDNERQETELPPFTIGVKPSTASDAEVNSEMAYSSNVDSNTPFEEKVSASRRIKELNGVYIVKVAVEKDQLSGMAKVVETIPDGFTAESIENANGVFTNDGNNVKFLWMNMSQNPQFEVSYKLTPVRKDADISAISGNFSYSSAGVTKTLQIATLSEEAQLTQAEINESKNLVDLPGKEIDAIATNVTYKVQIAAGHKLVNVRKHFKKYKIYERVTVSQHEGWHKYTVGKFLDYKGARDHRVKIWNETKATDAFVAAYNGGQRITVQEALMIASHKWYQ